MEERHRVHNEMAELLNQNPNIQISYIKHTNQDECPFDWLKKDSKEYYLLANYQYTLYPLNVDVLTQKGLQLYCSALMQYYNNNFTNEIEEYYIDPQNSGSWFADENSEWYGKANFLEEGSKGCFNSWNNMNIVGMLKDGSPISTSTCIFINQELGWCLTKSRSLYKLGKNVERETINNKIKEYHDKKKNNDLF